MSQRFNTVMTFVAAIIITMAALFLFGLFDKPASSVTDIAVNEVAAYHDFHTCELSYGETAYEIHFGGMDRSRRAQLVYRHDNIGRRTLRVVTNDPSLPKGHVRLVVETKRARDLEGHNFGTAWSAEVLQINPRRPIRPAGVIPPCGPERR